MNRRAFVALLACAPFCSRFVRAQQLPHMPRIGVLLAGTPASFSPRAKALQDGMQALGYVEGKTVAFEWRWGEDRVDRLPDLAAAKLDHA